MINYECVRYFKFRPAKVVKKNQFLSKLIKFVEK